MRETRPGRPVSPIETVSARVRLGCRHGVYLAPAPIGRSQPASLTAVVAIANEMNQSNRSVDIGVANRWGKKWGEVPHGSQPNSISRKRLEAALHVSQPNSGLGLMTRRSRVRIPPVIKTPAVLPLGLHEWQNPGSMAAYCDTAGGTWAAGFSLAEPSKAPANRDFSARAPSPSDTQR